MIEKREEYQKMAAVEETLWWYRTLHGFVITSIKAATEDRGVSILDAGCGCGGLLLALQRAGFTNVQGCDLSPFAVEYTASRGFPVVQLDLREIGEHYQPESVEVVCSNDTLYFFRGAEQTAILTALRRILKPGGVLILNVPAFQAFAGIHDVAVGIVERFSLSDVTRLASQDGFMQQELRFWPFLLSPLIAASRMAQRVRLRLGQPSITSDVHPTPHIVNELLYACSVLERRIFRRSPPWGSSAYLVLKKPLLS